MILKIWWKEILWGSQIHCRVRLLSILVLTIRGLSRKKKTFYCLPGTMIQEWQRTACTNRHYKTGAGHIRCVPSCKTAKVRPIPASPPSLKGTSTYGIIYSQVRSATTHTVPWYENITNEDVSIKRENNPSLHKFTLSVNGANVQTGWETFGSKKLPPNNCNNQHGV